MKLQLLSRTLLAALFGAMTLVGASVIIEDDGDGSRVCVGSLGMQACVPLS